MRKPATTLFPESWLKRASIVLGMLVVLFGGFRYIEATYAKVVEVKGQVDGLKALYFQQRISDLEREEFGFRREAQRRALTELELQRLETVRKELEYLKEQIKPIQPGR